MKYSNYKNSARQGICFPQKNEPCRAAFFQPIASLIVVNIFFGRSLRCRVRRRLLR